MDKSTYMFMYRYTHTVIQKHTIIKEDAQGYEYTNQELRNTETKPIKHRQIPTTSYIHIYSKRYIYIQSKIHTQADIGRVKKDVRNHE